MTTRLLSELEREAFMNEDKLGMEIFQRLDELYTSTGVRAYQHPLLVEKNDIERREK